MLVVWLQVMTSSIITFTIMICRQGAIVLLLRLLPAPSLFSVPSFVMSTPLYPRLLLSQSFHHFIMDTLVL